MLDESVLVLNRSWMPLQVASVRRSIVLLFRGHAAVVCPDTFRTFDFEDWKDMSRSAEHKKACLHTPNYKVIVPEVLVLCNFNRLIKRRIRFNRQNIMERDNHTCQYCGSHLPAGKLTLEHIVPVSKGGESSWENVVAACSSCNNHKADRTPQEAGMSLMKKPSRPRREVVSTPRLPAIRPTWQPFIGNLAATAE